MVPHQFRQYCANLRIASHTPYEGSSKIDFKKLNSNLAKTIVSSRLEQTFLPLCPQISLYLLCADYPHRRLAQEEMLAIMDSPAYWAFCWASGQVLAAYILTHPYEFRGKSVLDFGCGSGVVGIAAAMAGATHVMACDNDPMAIDAAKANAELNHITMSYVKDLACLDGNIDIVIAADVLYDRENLPLLDALPRIGEDVVVADSRIKDMELRGYHLIDTNETTTIPDLDEYQEFNQVKIYRADHEER